MRGALAFARARHWLTLALVCPFAALLIVLCGPLNVMLNPRMEYPVAVAAMIPVIPSIAIGATLEVPSLATSELHGSRDLRPYRLLHVALWTITASALLGAASLPLTLSPLATATGQGAVSVVRNVAALTGSMLIGSAILGHRFAWTLPLSWIIVPALLIPNTAADPTGFLTLISQSDRSILSLVIAVTTWAVGVFFATTDVSTSHLRRHR